jgi:hypothetical protein
MSSIIVDGGSGVEWFSAAGEVRRVQAPAGAGSG